MSSCKIYSVPFFTAQRNIGCGTYFFQSFFIHRSCNQLHLLQGGVKSMLRQSLYLSQHIFLQFHQSPCSIQETCHFLKIPLQRNRTETVTMFNCYIMKTTIIKYTAISVYSTLCCHIHFHATLNHGRICN